MHKVRLTFAYLSYIATLSLLCRLIQSLTGWFSNQPIRPPQPFANSNSRKQDPIPFRSQQVFRCQRDGGVPMSTRIGSFQILDDDFPPLRCSSVVQFSIDCIQSSTLQCGKCQSKVSEEILYTASYTAQTNYQFGNDRLLSVQRKTHVFKWETVNPPLNHFPRRESSPQVVCQSKRVKMATETLETSNRVLDPHSLNNRHCDAQAPGSTMRTLPC